MELNCCRQAAIKYTCHHIPQQFYQAHPTEVPIPLQDKDKGLTGALLREADLAEGGPDHTDDLLPEDGVGGIFSRCLSHPGPEVFRPHPGRASGLVCADAAYRPCELILLMDVVVHRKGCHIRWDYLCPGGEGGSGRGPPSLSSSYLSSLLLGRRGSVLCAVVPSPHSDPGLL